MEHGQAPNGPMASTEVPHKMSSLINKNGVKMDPVYQEPCKELRWLHLWLRLSLNLDPQMVKSETGIKMANQNLYQNMDQNGPKWTLVWTVLGIESHAKRCPFRGSRWPMKPPEKGPSNHGPPAKTLE